MSQETLLGRIREKYINTYRKRTPKAQAAGEATRKYIPGGSRTSLVYQPYLNWIDRADGCRIIDIDGNEYIDFHNCYTAMVLGHGNPKVKSAIREQIERGMAFGTLVPVVTRWAQILCQRLDSVEKIRFTNSGTEAAMLSLRLARAFTGKDKILRIEGGYHGQYDGVVYPPDAAGLPRSTRGDYVFVPFNDEKALERTITQNRDQLAAMILEGVMAAGGYATARDGYLEFVREITAANNVLLVLDEVQTLRFDYGGMQHICGIKPDLTVLGKIIGGGTPVGACGGREDIMQQISPSTAKFRQSGTYNSNPVTAAAGVASLEQLTSQEIARINKLGQKLTDGIRSIFARQNIKGQVTGLGSVRHINFGQVPVVDYKTSQETNKDLLLLLHLALQERGIYLPEGSHLAVSTPMTEKEIDTAVKAVDDAMTELKSSIEQIWPELVGSVEEPPDIKLDGA